MDNFKIAEVYFSQMDSLFSFMFFFRIVCVLAISILYMTKYFLKNKNKPKVENEIPLLSSFSFGFPLPALLELLNYSRRYRKDGVHILEKMVKKGGTLFRLPNLLDGMFIVVSDPHLLQKILCSNEDDFLRKPKFWYDIIFLDTFRLGVAGSDLKIWRPHRKVLEAGFTRKNFVYYLNLMNKLSRDLTFQLSNHGQDKNGVAEGKEMRETFTLTFFKIISEVMLGERAFTDEEVIQCHYHFKKHNQLHLHRLLYPVNFIPLVWKLNPKSKEYHFHGLELRKLIMKGIENCKRNLTKNCNKNSNNNIEEKQITSQKPVLETMITCNASDAELYNEIGTALMAGYETIDFTIHNLLQLLAENPNYQARCQAEVDELFSGVSGNLAMDDLTKLKYLEQCILESLRIAPAGPVFGRELGSDREINGLYFKKGTIFYFPVWGLHRDPTNYPNPETYDPDRFLQENIKKRHPMTFLPFSNGPRGCLGHKLAMIEMKTVMAWVLHHFEAHTDDRFTSVRFNAEVLTVPERPFNFYLKKRIINN